MLTCIRIITISCFPRRAAVTQEGRQKLELKHGANTFCVSTIWNVTALAIHIYLCLSSLQIELDASKRIFIAVVSSNYPTNYIFSSSRQTSGLTYRLMTEYKNRVMNALAIDGTLSSITSLHGSTSQIARFRRAVRPLFKPLFEKWENAKNIDLLLEKERAEKLAKAGSALPYQENVGVNVNLQNSASSEFDGLLSPTYESRNSRSLFGLKFLARNKGNAGLFTSYEVATRSFLCLQFKSQKQMFFLLTSIILIFLLILLLVLNYAVFRWF